MSTKSSCPMGTLTLFHLAQQCLKNGKPWNRVTVFRVVSSFTLASFHCLGWRGPPPPILASMTPFTIFSSLSHRKEPFLFSFSTQTLSPVLIPLGSASSGWIRILGLSWSLSRPGILRCWLLKADWIRVPVVRTSGNSFANSGEPIGPS